MAAGGRSVPRPGAASVPVAARPWPALADAASVLVVPLGATEQHGPHMPLRTDTAVAVALARAIVAARPGLTLAPELPYGASGEHEGFPGTLSIGTAALEHLLVELGRSASRTFPGLLLVSGHGGNAEAVRGAVALLRGEGRDVRALGPRWSGDAHAGRTETSVMLHLAPEEVDLGAAAAGETAPVGELAPRLRAAGVRPVSANGVLGDPAGAGAGDGRRLLAEATAAALARVDAWWPPVAEAAP